MQNTKRRSWESVIKELVRIENVGHFYFPVYLVLRVICISQVIKTVREELSDLETNLSDCSSTL